MDCRFPPDMEKLQRSPRDRRILRGTQIRCPSLGPWGTPVESPQGRRSPLGKWDTLFDPPCPRGVPSDRPRMHPGMT
eukprot:scaffold1110_cov254-Pinguiococcus_pyrenoidosus.AAC.6